MWLQSELGSALNIDDHHNFGEFKMLTGMSVSYMADFMKSEFINLAFSWGLV